jgi:hypothetical protein
MVQRGKLYIPEVENNKKWFVYWTLLYLNNYEGEPVNRSQMDIKCKTCYIQTWKKKIYFSTYPPSTSVHLSHHFTSESKPTAEKFFACCLSQFCTSFQPLLHQWNFCHQGGFLVHFFFILQFSGHPPCAQFPQLQTIIMLYAKPWNTVVQLLHCLSLPPVSSNQLFHPPAQLLLSQSQEGNLVGHHLWFSNVLERISLPSCKLLYVINFSTINRKHFFMNILCIESFCPPNKHNRTLLLSSTLLKHGHHFNYWNQPLIICMFLCYLDCHEAGLCCYLVIHIENLLHPLQLFYFHLRPIYWLSLI